MSSSLPLAADWVGKVWSVRPCHRIELLLPFNKFKLNNVPPKSDLRDHGRVEQLSRGKHRTHLARPENWIRSLSLRNSFIKFFGAFIVLPPAIMTLAAVELLPVKVAIQAGRSWSNAAPLVDAEIPKWTLHALIWRSPNIPIQICAAHNLLGHGRGLIGRVKVLRLREGRIPWLMERHAVEAARREISGSHRE